MLEGAGSSVSSQKSKNLQAIMILFPRCKGERGHELFTLHYDAPGRPMTKDAFVDQNYDVVSGYKVFFVGKKTTLRLKPFV